jgi:Flp pilus assembly protein TadB
MTPRRRRFEAYHKTAGYFSIFFAAGAVASGLMQYPMPLLVGAIVVIVLVFLAVSIVLEYKGYRYDGYRAAHGYTMDAPFNKERERL